MVSLAVCVLCALVLPQLTSGPWLIGVLVAVQPCYGTLYAPASALVASGAERTGLNQGIAFAVSNLTWAAGQSVAAVASGALAQATSDLVPYALLAAACLGTLIALRGSGKASARTVGRATPSDNGDTPARIRLYQDPERVRASPERRSLRRAGVTRGRRRPCGCPGRT